mgnify:CR=1 FL=1
MLADQSINQDGKETKNWGQVHNQEFLVLRRVTPTIVRWIQLIVLSDFSLAVCTCFIGNNDRHSPAYVLRDDLLAGLCDKAHSEILIGVVLSKSAADTQFS